MSPDRVFDPVHDHGSCHGDDPVRRPRSVDGSPACRAKVVDPCASVGQSCAGRVDPVDLGRGLPWLGLFLGLIVVAKVGVALALARLARIAARPLQVAVGLGQMGEFSFVLASALVAAGAIGGDVNVAAIAAVAISIAMSTVLIRLVPVGEPRMAGAG